jgi:cell division septum initiation protein DivIVA
MKRGSAHLLAALLSTCLVLAGGDAIASPSTGATSTSARSQSTHVAAKQKAAEIAGQATLRSDRIHNWLREARAERRLIRARCVDRLLSQAHAVERQAHLEERATRRSRAHVAMHLSRLVRMEERSRRIAEEAYWCGKKRSQRTRMPTTYQVRVDKPRLPTPTYARRPKDGR